MGGTRVLGRVLFVVVAVGTFFADRLTKVLVEDRLRLGEQVRVLGDALTFRHLRNSGIAFGLFSDAGSLVVAGTLLVGVLLFVFMMRVEPGDLITICGGGCITGGALGNLVDRVQHGYVTDFLHLPRWPTFNVADVAITIGVVLVLLAQLLAVLAEGREARALQAGTPAEEER
ncbi:MAG: lipoprotein signal peptidase [Thermoleophilia bacterium]|nr:lipoprotein signal peptidase [Thermoleophilia bacterium]